MNSMTKQLFGAILMVLSLATLAAAVDVAKENKGCVDCHRTNSPALVMEWERSRHADMGVGCLGCHQAIAGVDGAWKHQGAVVSVLVTPKTCGKCHDAEHTQFSRSHHAKAGEILASLDNVVAEKMAGLPDNKADAVSGCWQCHGSIIKFKRNKDGKILTVGPEDKPMIDPTTWPNSGIGRLNPDGSKGSCHACHSRHSFEAKIARSPDNCGKCHMGPEHPQVEIFYKSKHGIAFRASRDKMALDKEAEWVLGKDYSAAPTCATCHISSYMTPEGTVSAKSHDVGERISWNLRTPISVKLNLVTFEGGYKENYPETLQLPEIGETVNTVDKVVENEKLVSKNIKRKVVGITTWQERRARMKSVCLNCHGTSFVDNFYQQLDDLVRLFNKKFAMPAQEIMGELMDDGVLKKNAPFEHEVQWIFRELWLYAGGNARHGAAMMAPDYMQQGMYEASKNYYIDFLPAVVKAAREKSPELGAKYQAKVDELLIQPEHRWLKGLSPQEAEALRKTYEQRYNK